MAAKKKPKSQSQPGRKKSSANPEFKPALLCRAMWDRYEYLRDNGHDDYIRLADRCGRFWYGSQWEEDVVAKLRQQRRPYLTMNMILTTTDTVLGEQINNRNETRFRPRYGKNADATADALNKVYKHISQGNNLTWLRSDVFEDGLITGRGYYEVRLDFTDNLFGEVRITRLDPKNVMIDADATEYDPETWNDVTVTRWLTPDDIEVLYGKAKADELRGKVSTYESTGTDIVDDLRDRVSSAYEMQGKVPDDDINQAKYIRILDRQYRQLTVRRFFANLLYGDLRSVPDDWDDARITEYLAANPNVAVLEKQATRIRWTVVACNTVLYDDWSPYEHFTVVPYFPHFRNGRTTGMVEQLISVQELLNKSVSQELHIVNTTANSGWKVKKGALQNMTETELEVRGAETGLVAVLDDINNMDKIQPNQIPSGIDRLAQKAEQFIKTLGVSDYMRGDARADVSARALEANQNQGQNALARVLDNLVRSDVFLARVILNCVQTYYIEERVLFITGGDGRPDETITINQVSPEGEIVNDMTVGEYLITVDSAPARESLEDSQFEQALALRKEGIPIPDSVLIRNSRLLDKQEIIEQMEAASNSPEAKRSAEADLALKEAEVKKMQADAERLLADADNKASQAQQKKVDAAKEAASVDEMTPEQGRTIIEKQRLDLERERTMADIELKKAEMRIKEAELAIKQQEMQLERERMRIDAVTQRMQAKLAAQKEGAKNQTEDNG